MGLSPFIEEKGFLEKMVLHYTYISIKSILMGGGHTQKWQGGQWGGTAKKGGHNADDDEEIGRASCRERVCYAV